MRGSRGICAHGTEPPGCLAARTGPSVAPRGGLVTDGMRAIDGITPCGVIDPIRVNGGLNGDEPASNGQADGQRRTTPLAETGGGTDARTNCGTW